MEAPREEENRKEDEQCFTFIKTWITSIFEKVFLFILYFPQLRNTYTFVKIRYIIFENVDRERKNSLIRTTKSSIISATIRVPRKLNGRYTQ